MRNVVKVRSALPEIDILGFAGCTDHIAGLRLLLFVHLRLSHFDGQFFYMR